MATISDHPQRYALANELHARPFPNVEAPARAALLAMDTKGAGGASADRDHLIALLDRHGAAHPQPEATHYSGDLGRCRLKWERHTEFVTYTLFCDGDEGTMFANSVFDQFPADWLAAAPGNRLTSALIDINRHEGDQDLAALAKAQFVPESLALSRMLENDVVTASDFRIDAAGHMRMAVFARAATGSQRIGRVVQRLCEIEVYKSMAMMGLSAARDLSPELSVLEARLGQLVADLNARDVPADDTLEQLLDVSAQLEHLAASSSYRFAATRAYDSIVNQRISILREDRFEGHQTFAEFMMRRFDPAMRTVTSTSERLESLTLRAARAANLLRTRVDVERSSQNQDLLESMDRRADVQLRLQQTVEGLSVVAISYYAVNLGLYLMGPVQQALDVSKYTLAAGLTPLVIVAVWLMVRRIRRKLGH